MSLFSGCGGLDLGAQQAGFKIVLANDLEPLCQVSHSANFPSTPFFLGSVTELDAAKLSELSEGATEEQVDLLVGGPPCPPYSKSRFYRKEKPRGICDPVGDETLRGYINVLKTVRPRAFLFENVHGFAYKVHREGLELLSRAAEEAGYECSSSIVNAADYGVPQIRKRFLMVGMLGQRFAFPDESHRDPRKQNLFAAGLAPWKTAGDAIDDLDTEENADDSGHFAGGQYHHLLRQVPPGDNYLYFTKERGYPEPIFKWRSRYWSFLLKLSPAMPSWTIQARRSNNMGPFHWRNRILRIDEVKRLQTFPDSWQLAGTIEQQWRQIGNAVPPLLAQRIASAIGKQLLANPCRPDNAVAAAR